jgi:hypothetical protein
MHSHYLAACERWQVVAVCSGMEVIGALFAKGDEIHLGIVPAWRKRWASRRVIREMLAYGTKTKVIPGDESQLDFLSRIGFVKEGDSYAVRR